MYLNDDYDGGGLEFVKVGYKFKGKTGDGIFFASMREGKPDSQSLHGAGPALVTYRLILSPRSSMASPILRRPRPTVGVVDGPLSTRRS
jgi:hypothetical protein